MTATYSVSTIVTETLTTAGRFESIVTFQGRRIVVTGEYTADEEGTVTLGDWTCDEEHRADIDYLMSLPTEPLFFAIEQQIHFEWRYGQYQTTKAKS